MNSDDALRMAAEELELTSELAITMFEFNPDAIVIVDEDGRIKRSNRQATFLFGYSKQELRGMKVDNLLPEPLRDAHETHRAGFMADPRMRSMGVDLDLRARKKNGVEVPVLINLSPVATAQGLFTIASIRRRGG
ncbi:PAS domain S-box protein [Plantactinospora sp. S1510]|uniref:PAS domain S-box protein n=1 Tax=Plantactinospora alkalitolerans TaxID=2789879 RepID=A0ABS0H4R7_9ACTN|nr:PAS domain S-box protein [Plantactinospora alkalitolerans]MBF9133459.1 PAS domain S-box protein [Plantactinospora alkalitolerans]